MRNTIMPPRGHIKDGTRATGAPLYKYAPEPGNQYIFVRISVHNKVSSPSDFHTRIGNEVGTIGASLIAQNARDASNSCRFNETPDRFDNTRSIFPGGELEGDVCFEVPSSDISSLLLYGDYDTLDLSDRTYIDGLWFWALR